MEERERERERIMIRHKPVFVSDRKGGLVQTGGLVETGLCREGLCREGVL